VITNSGHRLHGDGPLEPFIACGEHDPHAAFADFPGDDVMSDARRQVVTRGAGLNGGRGLGRRRDACQPLVQTPQPSFGSVVVDRLLRHKTSIIPRSRRDNYLKTFPSALLIAFVASSFSLFFMARVAASPTSMRTAGD